MEDARRGLIVGYHPAVQSSIGRWPVKIGLPVWGQGTEPGAVQEWNQKRPGGVYYIDDR
jgi:hypothetical protein